MPNVPTVCAIIAWVSAAEDTSVQTNDAVPPPALSWSTVSWPPVSLTSATTTVAPSADSRRAMPRPMPLPVVQETSTLIVISTAS